MSSGGRFRRAPRADLFARGEADIQLCAKFCLSTDRSICFEADVREGRSTSVAGAFQPSASKLGRSQHREWKPAAGQSGSRSHCDGRSGRRASINSMLQRRATPCGPTLRTRAVWLPAKCRGDINGAALARPFGMDDFDAVYAVLDARPGPQQMFSRDLPKVFGGNRWLRHVDRILEAREDAGREGGRNAASPVLHVFRRSQDQPSTPQSVKSRFEVTEYARHTNIMAHMCAVVGDRQHLLRARKGECLDEAFDQSAQIPPWVFRLRSQWNSTCTTATSPIVWARALTSCTSASAISHPIVSNRAAFVTSRRIALTGTPTLRRTHVTG